ncbi:MAG: AzlC family ABC transporter permease [Rubrivivax sp.]|jgi:predicted branched-subunit amino acid permease|nr:AzlC family ABC transporter permease [Rubrivivax sp.]
MSLPPWRHPEFRRGATDMLSVAPGIAAWGLVTGVAMIQSGLPFGLALFMSLVVFAASAQLAVLPLLISGAPLWVVWATAACVNLRFVIFSAQWRPYWRPYPRARRALLSYLTADLSFVLFMRRFPEPVPAPEQLPYVWGGIAVNAGSWHVASIAGLLLAGSIPLHWGLGFAGTLALLGLTCSLLVDRASWIAAGVAGAAAVAAYALPLKLNIVVAIAAAVTAGLLVDRHTARPALPADDRT